MEGAIVNVASIASVDGGYAPAAYTASKWAVVGLTKQVTGCWGACCAANAEAHTHWQDCWTNLWQWCCLLTDYPIRGCR